MRTLLAGAGRLDCGSRPSRPWTGAAPSIVDLAPAAGWDEREAHDLYGVGFAGHEPLRPLVDHDLALDHWTVPVRGGDAYQVAVGPIHAGVIESGHFRFHVVGDRILHLDARLFYKHRGLERAAEGATLDDGLAYAARACAACAVSNGVAYAHACEEALGLEPTAELARARTILLELERMWSHLNDIAAVCAGVGLAAGNTSFAAPHRARAAAERARSPGHRFLFGTVRVGGSDLDARRRRGPGGARASSAALRAEAAASWRELLFNASFQDRLPDVGVVTRRRRRAARRRRARRARRRARRGRARRRARGSPTTASSPSSRSAPPATCRRALEQRALELLQTFDAPRRAARRPASARRRRAAARGAARSASAASRARAARRRCVVERDGDRIERAAPPHRLVRQLAGRRVRRRRTTCSPTSR